MEDGPVKDRLTIASELALAAMTAMTVVSFVRLFNGTSFLWPLLLIACVSHLVAAIARHGRWPVAAAIPVTVAAALVALTATQYRARAWVILPTPSVLSHMHADLQHAATMFRTVTAPTAPLPGFIIVLAVLVVMVTIASDTLAFRLHAMAEAVTPAAGLFLLATVLGGDRLRLQTTALFVATALTFVLLHRTATNRQAVRRISSNSHRDIRTLLRGGAVVIVATCLIGAAAAAVSPHQHQSPWTRWRGPNDSDGTRVTVSPLVNLRDRLLSQANVLLFTVHADQPAYWRLTALDHFSDDTWSASNSFSRAGGNVDRPDPAGHTHTLRQRFSLLALAQVWAPAAYQPAKVTGTNKLLYDANSGTLIVTRDRTTSDNLTYDVTSDVPSLTAAALTRPGAAMGQDDLAHYTELPANLPEDVRSTARTVVANAHATSEYTKALALQNWLRNNFTYNLHADYSKTNGSVIEAFLHQRQGWCEQFAGTYGVMARSLGLPTRLAVGFTPGQADPNHPGTFDVFGRQAHAWPEVWFPGQGWVAFEPTPGRGAPGATTYTGIPFQQDIGPTGAPGGNSATAATPAPSPQAPTTTRVPGASGPAAAPSGASGATANPAAQPRQAQKPSGAWPVVVLVVGTIIALLIAIVVALALLRWWLRTRRRRSAHSSAELIDAAWNEACDAVGLLAAKPSKTETRFEYAARSATSAPQAGEAMDELAHLATTAQWAPTPPDPTATARADAIATHVDDVVRNELGTWRHAIATLDPRTLREMASRR